MKSSNMYVLVDIPFHNRFWFDSLFHECLHKQMLLTECFIYNSKSLMTVLWLCRKHHAGKLKLGKCPNTCLSYKECMECLSSEHWDYVVSCSVTTKQHVTKDEATVFQVILFMNLGCFTGEWWTIYTYIIA